MISLENRMTFFYFFVISLCSFLYATEEVTSALGAIQLDDNILSLDKFDSKKGHFYYCNTKGDVFLPETFNLTWSGDEVYEIQAAGNIVFHPNARIVYTGSGGGLILRPYYTKNRYQYSGKNILAGTLIFAEGSQSIDFSQSSNSSISIFYRPSANGSHKYQNPTDFFPHVRFPEDPRVRDSIYLQAFMLVEDKNDFCQISRFEGNYALGQTMPIDQRNESDRLVLQPNSVFNMNKFDWDKKGGQNPDFDLFVLGESFSRGLRSSPPYLGFEKTLMDAAQTGDMSVLGGRWFYDCRIIDGSTRGNLMHIAAKRGHTHFLKKTHENIVGRSGLIIDNWHFFLHLVTASDKEGNTVLDLAAFGEHFGAINWLVGILKDRANVSAVIEKVRAAVQTDVDGVSELRQKHERVINYLHGLYDTQRFGKYWLGYPIARVGFEEEYRYAQYTNQRFFMKEVGTTKTYSFLESFKVDYVRPSISSFGLEGIPARSRIILFRNIADIKRANQGNAVRFKGGEDQFPIKYRVQQDPAISVSVRNDPTQKQPGNVYLVGLPRYDPEKIPANINQIVERFPDNQGNQKVAFLLRQSRLLGMPITIEHLLDQRYEGDHPQDDVVFLNKLGLLLDFEVSRRLPEQPTLPIGISSARAFTLIEKGYLTWGQFLTKENPYHLFSGNRREEAIYTISDLFHQKINKRQKAVEVSLQTWKERRAYGQIIASEEEMHQELLEQFGGGYESEGEDYVYSA